MAIPLRRVTAHFRLCTSAGPLRWEETQKTGRFIPVKEAQRRKKTAVVETFNKK